MTAFMQVQQRAGPLERGPWAAPAVRRCRVSRRGKLVAKAAAAPTTGEGAAASQAAPLAAGELLALKEWAPTCAAVATGEQTVLLRKGGIKEPTFKPVAREFLLFPTSFHTDAQLLKPGAQQRYAAEVQYEPKSQPQLTFATWAAITGAWTTFDPAVLQLLDDLHVWAPGFLENRLRWRQKQPITVLELRAVRLEAPLVVPPQEDFWGCFSWLDLSPACRQLADQPQQAQHAAAALAAAAAGGGAAAAAAALPGTLALDDAVFAERQRLCRQQLGKLADLQELSL